MNYTSSASKEGTFTRGTADSIVCSVDSRARIVVPKVCVLLVETAPQRAGGLEWDGQYYTEDNL